MADRSHLDLGNYLPYLINRVGFALVESFTTDALTPNGLSIAMWRVLAALSNRGEQRQIDLVDMTSIDASTMSRLVTPARAQWPGHAQPLGEKQPRGRGRAQPERPGPGAAA